MTVRVIALSGFLGAGKTTAMAALGELLESRGETVALITNDQGADLVDSRTVAMCATTTAEVTGGCFCCRFDDLAGIIDRLVDERAVTTVVLESVGSCTDLQSTVIRPLRRLHGQDVEVAPLVTLVDLQRLREFGPSTGAEPQSDLEYLFERQLAEADIIALSKIDGSTPAEIERAVTEYAKRWPHARTMGISAFTGEGLVELVEMLRDGVTERDIDVDYDRYAAAEAALAWLNHSVTLTASGADGLLGATWAMTLLESFARQCASGGFIIGHVKVRVESPQGSVTANVVGITPPYIATGLPGRVESATALVNARVACTPEEMNQMVTAAIAEADAAAGAVSSTGAAPAAFSPVYPVPIHRLSAADA